MSGLHNRVVHLSVARWAPCICSNVAVFGIDSIHRLIGAASAAHLHIRHSSNSSPSENPGKTPPPAGNKPAGAAVPAAQGPKGEGPTHANEQATGAAGNEQQRFSSLRLPTLLVLLAPAAAYGTFGYYEQNLPTELRGPARHAKEVADAWVDSLQSTVVGVASGLKEKFPFLPGSQEQTPTTTQDDAPLSLSSQPDLAGQSVPASHVPDADASERKVEIADAASSDLAEQSEALVQVVDMSLLDQLLSEALVSDLDSSSTPPSVTAQLLPDTPGLQEAVKQLQASLQQEQDTPLAAPSGPGTDHQATGGVDADHHVPAAHDLLRSAAADLGISQDLSPSGLVKNADQLNAGARDDWKSFAAQHRQATADALAFQAALQQAKEFHAQQTAKLLAELNAAEERTQQVRKEAEQMAEKLKDVIKVQQQKAVEEARLAVKRAEQELLAAQAQHALQERRERLSALDETREKLNQVSAFASAQAKQAQEASFAQQRLLGLLSFQQALETGSNIDDSINKLQKLYERDEEVQLALKTLPGTSRLPTSSELISSLNDMKRRVASLSYLPEGGGGILASALSYLAASLKLMESAPLHEGTPLHTDAAFTLAQQLIVDGKLAEAAEVVENAAKGTAASSAVRPWLAQARKLAVARQTADFLMAHAAVVLAGC